MARFSRVDLYDNLKDEIPPLNSYWLAIDIKKYAIGNGNDTFSSLHSYDYSGQIIEYDPDFLVDSPNDVVIDGGEI